MLISVLVTFLVVILVLYLINLLPIDGRDVTRGAEPLPGLPGGRHKKAHDADGQQSDDGLKQRRNGHTSKHDGIPP